MLNNNDKQFNKIVKDAQSMSLSVEEKAEMKSNILSFMKTHTTPEKTPAAKKASYTFWQSLFIKKPTFQYAALAVVVAATAGYGVCSAAQAALPGDVLYPVKTQINEKVVGWLQFSDQA